MLARLGWLAEAESAGSYFSIWDFNQFVGLAGALADGLAPRPKRFRAIAAFVIMLSPEHIVFGAPYLQMV